MGTPFCLAIKMKSSGEIALRLTARSRVPAGRAEYLLFCEMLLQRPIDMRELGLSNILSREETSYMRQMASERFDGVMQVLKSMPRPMLLVFRNINTVRSINITLGAPVDRYFVMAKRSVFSAIQHLKDDAGRRFFCLRTGSMAETRGPNYSPIVKTTTWRDTFQGGKRAGGCL